jgi:type I restriction enzyme S subunit
MDSKTFFDNFETIANAPGGIARLRELILNLAVRGKLTEQISDERRLEISESDGFFEIPNNWVWSTLEEIADYGGRGSKSPNEIVDADWVLDLEDIEKTTSRLLSRVRSKDRKTTSTKARFEKGDVLYGKLRPYLDKVLVADTSGYCTTEIVPITPKFGLDPHWLRISLKSPMFIGYVTEKSYGMKMPRLGTKDAKASLHAVPPIEEQKRIVAKVDELMALCDELEAAQNQRDSVRNTARKSAIDAVSTATTPEELDVAWKRISGNWLTIADTPESISSLRSLILDLAVRGRLVERSGEDVWGEEIQLRDVGKMIRGVTYAKAESSKSDGPGLIPLLGAANIQREINFDGLTYVPERLIKADQIVCDRDVLICMSSGSRHLVGKTGSLLLPPRASFGAFCAVFRISNPANQAYIAMFFKSPVYRNAISAVSRGIGINNLRVGDVESVALVLPPIEEQKRIVAKVDELMELCDQLELSLIERNELAKKIAGSLASEVAA